MNNLIVIYGNPVNGFHFIGPFVEADDAIAWAEEHATTQDWWIAELDDPNELTSIGPKEL